VQEAFLFSRGRGRAGRRASFARQTPQHLLPPTRAVLDTVLSVKGDPSARLPSCCRFLLAPTAAAAAPPRAPTAKKTPPRPRRLLQRGRPAPLGRAAPKPRLSLSLSAFPPPPNLPLSARARARAGEQTKKINPLSLLGGALPACSKRGSRKSSLALYVFLPPSRAPRRALLLPQSRRWARPLPTTIARESARAKQKTTTTTTTAAAAAAARSFTRARRARPPLPPLLAPKVQASLLLLAPGVRPTPMRPRRSGACPRCPARTRAACG
jgi:hypothetical protein